MRHSIMKSFFVVLILTLLPTMASAAPAPESFADMAEKLRPAVVNISTTKTIKDEGPAMEFNGQPIPFDGLPEGHPLEQFNELFKMFRAPHLKDEKATSLGSGFVIDADGYVVTNNHVIEGAEEITVTFDDNTHYDAKVIGNDTKTDIAVLKVEAGRKLPFVSLGDSDTSRVGDWVMVIGNPFGLGGTVTAGIISARARDINAGPFDDFIQTDAAINRGNSGGPMFNMNGEVIGISTAIFSPNGMGNVGIGFATPSSMAKPVVDQLKSGKKVVRGWLGVKIQQVTEEIAESIGLGEPKGALVAEVTADSPAAKAGFKTGDIITSFDGKDIPEMKRLPRLVADTEVGREVEVKLMREGKEKSLKVKIAQLEENKEDKAEASPATEPEDRGGQEAVGMYLDPLTDNLRDQFQIAKNVQGLLVRGVKPESEAAERGMQRGDVIQRVNNTDVRKVADFVAEVKAAEKQGRKTILLLVYRGDESIFLALPLEKEKKPEPKSETKKD